MVILSSTILNADKMRLLNVQRDTKDPQNVPIMIAKEILAPNVIYVQIVSKPGVEKINTSLITLLHTLYVTGV